MNEVYEMKSEHERSNYEYSRNTKYEIKKIKLIMGKKIKLMDPKTGDVITVDEDNCYISTYAEMVKSGILKKKNNTNKEN